MKKSASSRKVFNLVNLASYGIMFLLFLKSDNIQAQIVPDHTLGAESSTITPNNVINGGAIRGTNLFHSFSEFNVGEGQGAYFSNPNGIDNIFSRVTGANLSRINGILGVLGHANLFLLNSNGIVFGPNARLDMRGSFLATTAESFVFNNGFEFSATEPQAPPLLTINIPIGLRFTPNPQGIVVQGTGHNITQPPLLPVERGNTDRGLQVSSGKTLALVGGDITLEGGTLTAEGGRVELGSVELGTVNLIQRGEDFSLGYNKITEFRAINLVQKASIDVSSGLLLTDAGVSLTSGGSIQVQGKNVTLTDGSFILVQNLGSTPSGNINVNASDTLQIIGTTPDGQVSSSIVNETLMGQGGDITIIAKNLSLQESGQLVTKTYSPFTTSVGGNIEVSVEDVLQMVGFSPINPRFISNISAISFASARAGDLTLKARQITLLDGGFISSGTTGFGNGGNVKIDATESLILEGLNPFNQFPSAIGASTLGSGNSGRLTINTLKLSIRNGATVSASTGSEGNAGNVIINASESVEVIGQTADTRNPSFIQSSAISQPLELREIFGLPDVPSGNSGNVIINTSQLTIQDKAQVNVRHDGTGNAGNLLINTENIVLTDNGGITASTASGQGGNIFLNVSNLVTMANESLISATAQGEGDGGNISINTPFLIVFPPKSVNGSDIIAKAEQGDGGRITIDAQGIFGIQERIARPGNRTNDLDASSEFGASGEIIINREPDPNKVLEQLPETVVDPDTLIAQNACKSDVESELVLTGRGGLPPSLNEDLNSQVTQVELIDPIPPSSPSSFSSSSPPSLSSSLIPTQGWVFNEKGEVVLVAYDPTVTGSQRLSPQGKKCNGI